MLKTTRRSTAGFTLVELLTVIAIIGILAGIVIPATGTVLKNAKKAADSANLRQIGQSSLIYAASNKDQLPSKNLGTGADFGSNAPSGGSPATVKLIAAALAVSGGLESGKMWVSKADDTTSKETENINVGNVLNVAKTALAETFSDVNCAFGYVAGLTTNYSPNTPIAYTRGIASSTDGKWSESNGTYKTDGGYIVFIGGNVAQYKNLGSSSSGELINSDGSQTNVITKTVRSNKASVRFLEEDASGGNATTASPTGS
jgi:prepilin-type N-terminal cleavage/methylation domain-containing protein